MANLHVDTRTFYDRISTAYDLVADAGERACRDQGLSALNARPGERVLEVGFGTGHALAALSLAVGPAGQVCGVDISSGMLAVARRTVAGAGSGRVDLALNDARSLYGVYDLHRDEGWVSVGIDHDTASFAVHAIGRWWQRMGRPAYPHAESLLITADAGGSNGSRLRLWKWELQRFASRTGLTITVCHFPPGTSNWNRIEHRLFSHIAMNWRGTPLVDLATIVSLIGSTHSRAGLRVRSELDRRCYTDGVTITDAQMARIRLIRHRFHGDWNYTIHPVA